LLSAHNVRAPNLGVACSPLLPEQATLTDPVLLIEILSPSNQAKTWSNVRAIGEWPEEPEQLAGGDLALTRIDFLVPMADLYTRTGLAGCAHPLGNNAARPGPFASLSYPEEGPCV
jgi:hypothetical protein